MPRRGGIEWDRLIGKIDVIDSRYLARKQSKIDQFKLHISYFLHKCKKMAKPQNRIRLYRKMISQHFYNLKNLSDNSYNK